MHSESEGPRLEREGFRDYLRLMAGLLLVRPSPFFLEHWPPLFHDGSAKTAAGYSSQLILAARD